MNLRPLCHLILLLQLLAFATTVRGQYYEKVFDFFEARQAGAVNKGAFPIGKLVQSSDGSFYGTTSSGGTGGIGGDGTAFKMTPAGALTTLAEFSYIAGGDGGATPAAGLVQGNDGNFYGTTREGGTNNFGTIFKMTPDGVITTLLSFNGTAGTNGGQYPNNELLLGNDGNFYGTTSAGGVGFGTLFRMTPTGVLSTLVEFTNTSGARKGRTPSCPLVQDSAGNIYGVTREGGVNQAGTIFKREPGGAFTTLVEFTGSGASNRGAFPSGLIQGSDANFYGTTTSGALGFGTVFTLTPAGVLTTLVEFTGTVGPNKGHQPNGLVLASDGNFYGTTSTGGADAFGTIFKMSPTGDLTTLVEFTGNGTANRGAFPSADLVQGSDGSFYGSTYGSQGTDFGSIFKVTPDGVLTTLVEFTNYGGADVGYFPGGQLIQSSNGDFLGTTLFSAADGLGTIFTMTPTGRLTTLAEFTGKNPPTKGSFPVGRLARGSDGSYYGTTFIGGLSSAFLGFGTVYRVELSGAFTTLVEFTGNGIANKGSFPDDGLVLASNGNFFGTTSSGGANNAGTVFTMTPSGVLTTLVEFTGNGTTNKGSSPSGVLVQGNDGNLYGTTSSGGANGLGTVYVMTPAGALTTLLEFTGNGPSNKGRSPQGSLVQGNDGNFYGTTMAGGASDFGTVFRMSPAGTLTTLVEFFGSDFNEGASPEAGLIQGGDGNFYGTTRLGGAGNYGTVFQLTPDGVLTTLVEFLDTNGYPQTELTVALDGNLYGTTEGDLPNCGSIFRLIFPGAPSVLPTVSRLQGSTSILLEAQANARGSLTNVAVDYGTDGTTFPNTAPLAVGLSGYQTKLVGTTLTNLSPATTYFYRLHATSSAGTTMSAVQNFPPWQPPS